MMRSFGPFNISSRLRENEKTHRLSGVLPGENPSTMNKNKFLADRVLNGSWSLAAAFALATLVTGCNKSNEPSSAAANAATGDPIKVGEFASLTGKEASFGQSSHDGTELAIDELNDHGGVLGRKLQLLTEDDQSKQGESKTIARKLISRDGIVALLGEVASGRSLEAAPVCQESHIPQISPSSTNPKVTQIGDYIFRVCFTDPLQGRVLARFARQTLKVKRVAVLTDAANTYSDGLSTYFKEAFPTLGGTIVDEQKYSGGDKDFNAQLTTIKAANPGSDFHPGLLSGRRADRASSPAIGNQRPPLRRGRMGIAGFDFHWRRRGGGNVFFDAFLA